MCSTEPAHRLVELPHEEVDMSGKKLAAQGAYGTTGRTTGGFDSGNRASGVRGVGTI
jgi:hypothetical protein